MKYIIIYCILFTSLIIPHKSFSFIQELQQLEYNLNTLSTILKKTQPSIATYEKLKKIIDSAYTAKNPNLLDNYEQSTAVTTAKYLLQELIKEDGRAENRPEYIPLMAYVAQQVTERYPDKRQSLHCVSLAAGNLENELLLARTLRYLGYKMVRLVPIDIMYNKITKIRVQNIFSKWCINRNIPVSLEEKPQLQDTVVLTLFQDAYEYIQKVYLGNLPKNHLFLMIQPGGGFPAEFRKDWILSFIDNYNITPNYLGIKNVQGSGINIYLPYNRSDFFVASEVKGKEKEIQNIKKTINEWRDKNPLYQRNLMTHIVNTFFGSMFQGPNLGIVGSDSDLLFYDLIKHTALHPDKPLAFKALNLFMTQISDMSGSMQDIFKRY